jgi:hypothetical protein
MRNFSQDQASGKRNSITVAGQESVVQGTQQTSRREGKQTRYIMNPSSGTEAELLLGW